MTDKFWTECPKIERQKFNYLKKLYKEAKELEALGKISDSKYEEIISIIQKELNNLEKKYD